MRIQFGFSGVIILLILAGVVVSGCASSIDAGRSPVTPQETQLVPQTTAFPSAENVVEGNNRFAFDLYSQLSKNPENQQSNIFFSPFSLSSVFAITYEGAQGTTADEIQSVFHFPSENTTLREGFSGLSERINNGEVTYTLHSANALWAERSYPFLPAYLNTSDTYYGAKTQNLNFIGQPEESRETINRWVENQTEDQIKNMLEPGFINRDTRLVITNAIYFKGKWEKPFAEADTRNIPFFFDGIENDSVTIPAMHRKDIYGYTETSDLQMIELPYKADHGSGPSMFVILPKKYGLTHLTAVENSLNAHTIRTLQHNLADTKTILYLPKFRLETQYQLPQTLEEMGVKSAFTNGADFSGMDGSHSLFISDVIHKAFIDVNEEGTEAAASSAVKISQGGPPPEPFFYADHPFIFIIEDRDTGAILFMGRVMNPNA